MASVNILQAVSRAMDHHRNGRLIQAEAEYRDILIRDPKNGDALHLLGTIVAGRGDTREGISLIERALEAMPKSPEAHFNLANIFAGLYRFEEAGIHFRTAFRLNPANAEAANGIGGVELRRARYEEAETWLKKALALDPRCVSALINMGTLMDATARFSETIAYYDRVLAFAPTHPEAHLFKALALLARGRLEEGWKEYGWRFTQGPPLHKRFPHPYWRGEPLSARKILVWTEQGLGDEMLAASMIPDLLRLGAHVVLATSQRLADLFARSFPAVEMLPAGRTPPAGIAYQASLSDLGQILRPSLEAFPAAHGYLSADQALARALRQKYLGDKGGLLVGISWRSKAKDGGTEKTVPLEQWGPVLRTPGVTFVNLQYGDFEAEASAAARATGATILTDSEIDPLGDMTPFASQVAAMDFVVTVSNTTAHVAGALGSHAAVLIPSNSGRLWYWFLDRSDSPWYPRVHLFRQRGAGWGETLEQVASMIGTRRSVNILR